MIAWRIVATPRDVDSNNKTKNTVTTLFHAFVESGCLSLVTELVAVAFDYYDRTRALILLAALGQIMVKFSVS